MFAPVPWLIVPPDSSCQPFTTEVLVTADWSGAIKLFVNRWHECLCNWHHHGNSRRVRRGSVSQSDSDVIAIIPLDAILDLLSQVNSPAARVDTIQDSCGSPHLHVLNSFVEQGRAVRWDANTWSCIKKLCCPENKEKLADSLWFPVWRRQKTRTYSPLPHQLSQSECAFT